MSKKVFNMQGGLHSAAAYSAFENRAWGSCVANAASFVVAPGTGMGLTISTGDGLISVDNFNARRIQVTTTETVTVPASSASFNRIDSVVAYIDTAVTATTAQIDNTNDILKFMVVAGTAAATPLAPTSGAIQAAIGAGNPYMVLYNVTVPQSATNTAGVTLSDQRVIMNVITAAQIAALAVTTAKLAAAAVTADKIADTAMYLGKSNVTATLNGTTSETTITSTVVTVPTTTRQLRVKTTIPQILMAGGGDRVTIRIKEDGVLIQQFYQGAVSAGWSGVLDFTKNAPSPGSHTYVVTQQKDQGTGGATLYAANSGGMVSIIQTTVELV